MARTMENIGELLGAQIPFKHPDRDFYDPAQVMMVSSARFDPLSHGFLAPHLSKISRSNQHLQHDELALEATLPLTAYLRAVWLVAQRKVRCSQGRGQKLTFLSKNNPIFDLL